MAKCPSCKQWLTGFNWTKTKNGKNWLKNSQGQWHDCPKNQKKFGWDLTYNPVFTPSYDFCGKCATLCVSEWCTKCNMYPNTTFNGKTETDNKWFTPDIKVSAVQDTNREEIMEACRLKYDPPSNGLHMNEDGTMPAGYNLTPELIKWYKGEESLSPDLSKRNKGDGKSILKELNSKITYKKRERKKSEWKRVT